MPTRDLLFLHQLSDAMRTYWLRGMVTFLMIAAGVVAATMVWPRTYQSEARIYVRLGRETVHLDPTATTGQTVSLADSREREIVSALELLRARTLFEQVVDQLGVDNVLHEQRGAGFGGLTDWSHLWERVEQFLAPREPETSVASNSDAADIAGLRRRESAVRKLMQSISCTSPKNSNVMIVYCKASSPGTARQRLERLLENYQEQHLRLHRISGSFAFFDAQAQEKKQLLDAKLLERRDAKNRISVASVESQRDLLSQEAVAITKSLLEAQAESAAAEARLDSLHAGESTAEQPLDSPEASGMSADAINLMRAKLFELEIEQQRLQAQLQPKHPRMKAILEQVKQAKTVLQRQEALVERSTILEMQKKISAAETQRAEVDAKLRALNEHEVELADIDRQVALLEVEHRKADENREQARTDEELTKSQISNINIAQSPSFAAKPVSPNLGLTLAFGLAAAFGGALTFVFHSAVRKGLADQHGAAEPVTTVPTTSPLNPSPEPLYRSAGRQPLSNGV